MISANGEKSKIVWLGSGPSLISAVINIMARTDELDKQKQQITSTHGGESRKFLRILNKYSGKIK